MSKKGSGKTYVSKGQHSNVSSSTLNGMKSDRDDSVKTINIQKAWLKGQNPWVTIANPNKQDVSKRFIRKRANEVWGDPKQRQLKIYEMYMRLGLV